MNIIRFAALGLLAFSPLAFAHPGHESQGLVAGFMHPLTGLDHLLVMLAVGMWAGRIGGAARWQLPATFVAVMALGAVIGMAGYRLPAIETLLAASVMALGALLVVSLRLPRTLQAGLVALFALFHGIAHGSELAASQGLAVMLGMLAATALLHVLGLAVSSRRLQLPEMVHSVFGCTMVVLGAWLLAS
ncbi:HupE/UreJ family protein [Methylobacillus flagellatus]|uniref:HupE/UreJ protein n=1 Tax=Methylobacillus flagellatus (strain ATCC 51484 / DSM 6875 / VKM B-1610 / KT) TaxID=265072 RepID=Q1H0F6_METFK|nr:HupE/UreJ family protein [Methylobacillus flagellatus]ABE50031.1 HupE/UreJ protein [Methylobacillus flagellatus KT]